MRIYVATKGSRLSDTDAQILGKEFERLQERGPLTPRAVVDAARPTHSVIHGYFEWDDAVAAESYREEQARYYLRSIEIVIKPGEETVRAFHVVTIPTDGERSYLHIETVRSDSVLLGQIIEAAKRELVSWQRRYRQYKALESAVSIVGEAVERLEQAGAQEIPA